MKKKTREQDIYYFDSKEQEDTGRCAGMLRQMISEIMQRENRKGVLLFCIGTDRSTGDSLGPLTGHKLKAAGLEDWIKFSAFLVYGLSMIGLYTASTLYHCVNTTVRGRLALRKYDHCSIYLLIAGSYTPICMTVLWGGVGAPLLLAIWLCAAAGIILTIAKLDIPRWLTSVIYLAMGWMALFAIAPLSRVLPAAGMFWLIAGGVLYTVGGVLYAVKWPGRNNPRFGCHEIFHVFIVLGSVSHFILMYSVVAPL